MFKACAFLLLPVLILAQVEDPIVETVYGPVQGQRIATHYDDGNVYVNSFYGIPFAADPIGDLRFEVTPPKNTI